MAEIVFAKIKDQLINCIISIDSPGLSLSPVFPDTLLCLREKSSKMARCQLVKIQESHGCREPPEEKYYSNC